MTWLSGTAALGLYTAVLLFYILRRQRSCYDIPHPVFDKFCNLGQVLGAGFLIHYLPYFLVDRTLFLHHYMPAYVFKVCILAAVVEHLHYLVRNVLNRRVFAYLFVVAVSAWLVAVVYVFGVFIPVTYGHVQLTSEQVHQLSWRDTWDLIIHK